MALGWKQEDVSIRSGGLLKREEVSNFETGRNQLRSDEARMGLGVAFGLGRDELAAYLDGKRTLEEIRAVCRPPKPGEVPLISRHTVEENMARGGALLTVSDSVSPDRLHAQPEPSQPSTVDRRTPEERAVDERMVSIVAEQLRPFAWRAVASVARQLDEERETVWEHLAELQNKDLPSTAAALIPTLRLKVLGRLPEGDRSEDAAVVDSMSVAERRKEIDAERKAKARPTKTKPEKRSK